MKKLLALMAVAALSVTTLTACGGSRGQSDSCDKADGTKACYDSTSGKYLIEDGAKIRVAVDNDNWGKAIVAAWDAAHPEHKGAVEFINIGSDTLAGQVTDQQGEAADVLFVIDGQTIANSQSMLQLEDYLATIGKDNGNEGVFNNINKGVTYYLPTAVDGMTFVWNKTMLETLGVDVTDANGDNLPDSLDTWEEIFALADEWNANRPTYKGKKVNVVFPMSLTNTWGTYSALTSSGWQIFEEGDATKPGFEKEGFLKGLEFIAEAGKHNLSVEEGGKRTPGPSMATRWDDVINNEIAPFGLVGTWMDAAGAEATTGSDFVFGPMPTYNGQQLTPFFKTKGWVINGFTKYPSAAHELVRMLYSKEGLETMTSNSSYVPALKDGAAIAPDLSNDAIKSEMTLAFTKNYLEPAGLVLPENTAKGAMGAYYDISIETFFTAVYDGTMTPAEAQAQIVELNKSWLAENNQ